MSRGVTPPARRRYRLGHVTEQGRPKTVNNRERGPASRIIAEMPQRRMAGRSEPPDPARPTARGSRWAHLCRVIAP